MAIDGEARGGENREIARKNEGAIRRLTERETAVLKLLADGKSNKEIARALCVTEHAVKAHVSNILRKLDAESRTEAAVIYTKSGLKAE